MAGDRAPAGPEDAHRPVDPEPRDERVGACNQPRLAHPIEAAKLLVQRLVELGDLHAHGEVEGDGGRCVGDRVL